MFSAIEPQRVIERASLTDIGAPPVRLYADGRPGFERTTQSASGSAIVLERLTPLSTREIVVKDIASGREQVVIRVQSANRVNATVSPDGNRIAYTMTPVGDSSEGIGFVVDTAGGGPRQICQACELYGFVSDNHRVLALTDGKRTIRLPDDRSDRAPEVLAVGDTSERVDRPPCFHPTIAIGLPRNAGDHVEDVRGALSDRTPADRRAWRAIAEPTTIGGRQDGRSTRASISCSTPMGSVACGVNALAVSGEVIGRPYPVRHFHQTVGMAFSTGFGNAVGRAGFLYEISARTGNIWRMQLPDRAGENRHMNSPAQSAVCAGGQVVG